MIGMQDVERLTVALTGRRQPLRLNHLSGRSGAARLLGRCLRRSFIVGNLSIPSDEQ